MEQTVSEQGQKGRDPESAPPSRPGPGGGSRFRVLVILVASIVVAGVGVAVVLAERAHHEPAPRAPDMLLTAGGVQLSASAPQWKYLEVASAARAAPLLPVPAPARVMVEERLAAPVFATLAGRVERVNVQLGQEVKPGDRLVAIRSSSLPELRHSAESARASLAVKKALVGRIKDLVELRAVPQKDLLIAEEEQREAELALEAAEGKRRSLRLGSLDDSGLYWVNATRKGTVVERKALIGMEVGPDRTDPLLSIADLSEVIVVADVLETETTGLKVGQVVQVAEAALAGKAIEGKIEYVAEFVDPVRRTVAVRIRVPNPEHKLRPNAFAQVTFPGGGEPRVIVPAEAVVTDDQKSVVFVKKDVPGSNTRIERREVRVGRARDGRSEILAGLEPGESYVAHGALLILNALDLAR
jgi:cobalt-zinc-cadmium efflux system membrane fusion protein